ncbi:unnamed protein product [Ilex paraguariensis]|uniref:Uncharacterized protein n=1 Tax=Ilex paraguariensis TaxID=185542 RepID=A0ABC8T3M5_9AQUA
MLENVHMIPEPPSWWHPTSSLPGFSTNHPSCGQSLDDDGNTSRNDDGSKSSDFIQRRTRGPTLTHGGSVLHIEENELRQPIGEKASPLQSRLGMLARNGTMAPLNWHEWRAVPKEYKEII